MVEILHEERVRLDPITIEVRDGTFCGNPWSWRAMVAAKEFASRFRLARRAVAGLTSIAFEWDEGSSSLVLVLVGHVVPRDAHLDPRGWGGEPFAIQSKYRISSDLLRNAYGDAQVLLKSQLLHLLRDFAFHEIAEGFYVDGKRPFDPHKDEEQIVGKGFDQVIVDDPHKGEP
jgi:hypothetical protein